MEHLHANLVSKDIMDVVHEVILYFPFPYRNKSFILDKQVIPEHGTIDYPGSCKVGATSVPSTGVVLIAGILQQPLTPAEM